MTPPRPGYDPARLPGPSRSTPGRRPESGDLRREGRHITLMNRQIAICGLCSALVATDDDGELRHLLFHSATDTIRPTP